MKAPCERCPWINVAAQALHGAAAGAAGGAIVEELEAQIAGLKKKFGVE
jgi:hypothetical protein